MTINAKTIDNLVSSCWDTVIGKINNGHPLSSEKTLCFLFATALFEKVGSDIVIDFENQCYEALEGESKYLDLLFYTDHSFKVAIEFKLPRRSKSGGSNQPQTREAIYRDLARLNYLKSHSIKASACYFLMAANENAYLNHGKYKKHTDLQVHHGHKVSANNVLVASGLSLKEAAFEFNWRSIKYQENKYVCDGPYAWLNPIRI